MAGIHFMYHVYTTYVIHTTEYWENTLELSRAALICPKEGTLTVGLYNYVYSYVM